MILRIGAKVTLPPSKNPDAHSENSQRHRSCPSRRASYPETRDCLTRIIPAVQTDSRLGWEAMQDYLCDEEALRWKMRQIDYELNFELPKFRKSNSL